MHSYHRALWGARLLVGIRPNWRQTRYRIRIEPVHVAYEHQQRHIKRPAKAYFSAIKIPSITSTNPAIHTDRHRVTELAEVPCGIMGVKKDYWREFMAAFLETTFHRISKNNIVLM